MRQLENSTRAFLFASFLIVGATYGLCQSFASSGPGWPANLRCEYLLNPLGIDVPQPRFSWVLEHTERGQTQSAYQLLVATRVETLDHDRGDQWDSGRVQSDQSIQVVYGGKPLESGGTYYWKVRFWDKQGNASPYSRTAQFEMGLMGREEWKGEWIGGANELRKEFVLNSHVVRARAYVTALGYYELRVNGRKIGNNVLDPGWTTFSKRVLYTTYDVTSALKQGRNGVGAMLGSGWATLSHPPAFKGDYPAPAFLLQMSIELAGGQRMSVASDAAWKVHAGPIVSDSIYDGEVYDARLETPGWDLPGFDDSGWKPAEVLKPAVGVLSAQMMPPIRVVDTIVPVALTNPKPRVYVYDMGQNFSGWAQLQVDGPGGAAVTMRFTELIYDNGMINRENIREIKARDTYTLRGEGVEVYEPRFTYHGFRYVELTGYPGTPGLDSLRGRVVHTAVESVGNFAASKPILNQIQKIIRWSQRTNLHSIPTDCDQRNERMGWMGDAQVTAEEAMLNFDMAAFYSNFVRDIRDVQGPDGTITDTVPHRYGKRPADPAWGTAYPILCWTMWEQYGDRRILEDHYDGLKKYVEFLRSRAPDHILRYSYYGDWVSVEPTPGAYVSAAYYYFDVHILAQTAEILGNSADAQTYSQLAAQIKEAFNRNFYDAATSNYLNGTQTANAMALYLDLVPKDRRPDVASNLTRDIVYRHDTHVTTGFIGVKYLMPALTQMGRSDLAYELATETTYPSWGYMISRGATTLWELWQEKAGPSMNSHNHAMFGSVGAWFYQALGGINLGSEGAGYRHLRIEPQMVRDLFWASASVETIRGSVSCSWRRDDASASIAVAIPVNSDATVVIPKLGLTGAVVKERDRVVWEKGHFVPGSEGLTGGSEDPDRITFAVGSGDYSFRLTGQ